MGVGESFSGRQARDEQRDGGEVRQCIQRSWSSGHQQRDVRWPKKEITHGATTKEENHGEKRGAIEKQGTGCVTAAGQMVQHQVREDRTAAVEVRQYDMSAGRSTTSESSPNRSANDHASNPRDD